MVVYPNAAPRTLSDSHRRMLFGESGIDPGVAEERGYHTARSHSEAPEILKDYQRKPGLVLPTFSPDGITRSCQLRPDKPRKDKKGKPLKYETPGGSGAILDVHPRMREEVRSGTGDLWITEGIKKADALTSRDLPTIGLIGVWNFQRGGEMLPCWDHVNLKRRAYVVYDNDVMVKEGVQLALQRQVRDLKRSGAEVLVVYLPDGPLKGVDDFLAAGHSVAELKMLARKFEPADIGRTRPMTAADLMAMTFEPTRWVVPGVLPEGLSLLVGKPKKGKSWMALGMCEAVAVGGVAFGTKRVEQGDTLYLALEDNTKRLQKRLRKVLDGRAAPEKMHLHTEWPRLDEGGAEQLDEWLTEHPDTRLVVIDTLAKIRKPAGGANIYAEDYAALELLLPLAAKHGVAIVVVHHLRKMAAADPMDEISSSTGLTAGVDGFLILRRTPGSKGPTLYVDGRDIEEPTEYALHWNINTATWTIEGNAEAVHLSRERGDILLTLNRSPEPMTPKEVADVTPGGTHSSVKKLMWTMLGDGQLIKDDKGSYSPTNPTNHGNPGNPGNPGNSGNRGNPPSESPQESFPLPAGLPGLPDDLGAGNPTYPDRYGEYDGRVTGVTGVTAAEACPHGTPTDCPCDDCDAEERFGGGE